MKPEQAVARARTVEQRVASVESAPPNASFVELFRDHAGLDPARHLRFFDWSGVDFSGCDLRGFDFTGANLAGCCFDRALIAGSRFDAAQVERASLRQAKDWRKYARAWAPLAAPPRGRHLPDLAVFSDAPFAPEMVAVPAGTFLMGSPDTEEGRYEDEGPQHEVTIGARFGIGRYPVTFEEYDHFCAETGREKPIDRGWGRGRWPVINVSWQDAVAYVDWLNKSTGQRYRLPSEAEWEYACRAGTTTRYAFGDAISARQANFDGKVGKTTEVGAYPANAWGLYDMHGNVLEWVEDVWHDTYTNAPVDGSAWTDGEGIKSPRERVYRGGTWFNNPRLLRSAFRIRGHPDYRSGILGFRVARTLS